MEAKCLVLLALVAATVAGPIAIQESDSCSTTCKPSNKFNYAPQTTYVYDYRVDTATSMFGASEDTARMTLQSRVNMEVISSCEFALTMSDTRLFHSDASGKMKPADGSAEFRRALEKNTLRFSYQDGVVESVCGGNNEPAWVLNIKKGMLSAFQNSMDDLAISQNTTETDISGDCDTEYKSEGKGYYSTTVKKNKNMLSCTDRHSYDTMIKMVQYKVPSEIQSFPITKTSQECSQDIENGGVLKSSKCTESHVYRPFANGQNGGATTIQQTLEYSTSRRGISRRRTAINSRDSLKFDHAANEVDAEQARRNVEQRLSDICRNTINDVKPDSPRLFSELVQAMKSVSLRDMESLYQLLKAGTVCPENKKTQKFFLDALPMVGTSASVKMMTSLLNAGEITGLQAKAWIASLAFVRTPDSNMILDAKTLIDNKKLRNDAILPVSSMVNNYCSGTASCDQDYNVLSLIRTLERILGYQGQDVSVIYAEILLALRGLGNTGHPNAANSINNYLSNSNNPLEIRIAAAEAFRRMPCDAEDMYLWKTFEDSDLDSELRIAAYLALIRCPTEMTLGKMAASLSTEENDQVGSFVYSHLTNLKETSDPHKQDIVKALNNIALDKEFDISPMKYSRNYEASALLNKINTGFTAESNLIWSSESQMPRSLSGNLTVELFGQAINLVDFGGRLEGLEYLVKNLFGQYIMQGNGKPSKADDVEGSFYGRIFGNEMLFLHSKTAKSPLKQLPGNWLDLLIALSEKHDYTLTQSAQFMDVSMMIPSSAGLPINVHVNGTGTVDLVLNGKMDLRKIGSKPRSLDINGEIKPSAAVEITGTMSVDAFVTKTGLRMRSSMHSSTSVKGRVQLDRGELLNVELDTPEDKIDIFSASSQFYIMHDNTETEQDMITENRKQFKVCSGDEMATITGMELCGEVSFPNASMKADSPYYPLTGPSKASLTLHKRDSHSGYKFFAKREESKKASSVQVYFNTPSSKVDRHMLAEVTLNYPRKEVLAKMLSPWKKATFSGAMINKRDMKSVSGSIEIDERDIYGMATEVKITQSKNKIQVNPMIELRRPGLDNIQLVGYAALQKPFKSLDVDMSLSGVQDMPYTFKGSLANNKKEKSLSGSFSTDGKNEYRFLASNTMSVMGKKSVIATLKSLFKVQTPKRDLVDMSGSADYKEGKSVKLRGSVDVHRLFKRPATFKLSMVKSVKKKGDRYDLDGQVKAASLSAKIDSNLFTKKSGFLSTKTVFDYTIPKVDRKTITLSGKWNSKSKASYKRYNVKSNLSFKQNPEYNLGLTMSLDHKKKNTGGTIELKYGSNHKDKSKRVLLTTSLLKKLEKKQGTITFKANALAPSHGIDSGIFLNHQHNRKSLDSSIGLTYGGKRQTATAGIVIKDKSKDLMDINGNVNVAWPGNQYVLKSDLSQTSPTQYEHKLNFQPASGKPHIITTVYQTPKPKGHSVSTNVRIAGMKPLTFGGSVTLDPKNFESSGEIKMGKDVYGISTTAVISKAPRGTVNIELVHPSRTLALAVDGGERKGKYDGSIEASWDAANDKTKKVTLSGTLQNRDSTLGGSLALSSPFKNFRKINTNIEYGSDDTKHNMNGKFSWGGKNEQIVTNLDIMKPVSLQNIKLTADAKTPFKGFRKATLDITHKLSSKMNTVVKGTLNKQMARLVIDGEAISGGVKGNIAMKTSLDNFKSVSVDVNHKSSNGITKSKAALSHNGEKYSYDLNMDHSLSGWTLTNIGDLTLVIPNKKVSTNWQHKSNDNSIQSLIKSDISGNRFVIDLSGSHDLYNGNTLSGDLKLKSPWKNMELGIDHKMDIGFINSNIVLKHDGKKHAFTELRYNRNDNAADAKFHLSTPFHEDITAKVNANYNRYPMTGSTEVQWGKRSKVDMEGSLNAEKWIDAGAELKMTTSFKGFRNLVLKATNSKDGEIMVSHVNVDFGVRKNIVLESRFGWQENSKLVRFMMSTPFDAIKSLDTGLKVNGNGANFDSSADFELLPVLGKFQAGTMLKYINNNLAGKLRIDTPFREYPYFELSTTSQKKNNVRNSIISAEYNPRQMYKLDTSYTFDFPITFEANLNTPHPQYDDLSLSFKHSHSPSTILTHGQIQYQPNQKIEGDLNANWSDDFEGSIVVKTPFEGYKVNQISARHQGNMDAFASHGEVNVAGQNLIADANYNGGHSSRGVFTFVSPVPGLESLELILKKRGYGSNIKGSATFTVSGEPTELGFLYRNKKEFLKSFITLSTPYSEDFKISVDHTGPLTNFNNKMAVNFGKQYDVDSDVTVDYRRPDVTATGMLRYKLGGPRDTIRLSFGKTGYSDDMTFRATASHNRDDVSINGSWKSLAGYDGSITLKTPVKHFKNVGLTMSHNYESDGLTSNFDLTYMDNKHIIGKITTETPGYERLLLTAEMHTPFNNFESTVLKANYDYEENTMGLNGQVDLRTTIGHFGTGSIIYSKTGDLDDLVVDIVAENNGRKLTSLKVTNSKISNDIHSQLNFDSLWIEPLELKFDHLGDISNMNSKASAKYGMNTISGEANLKHGFYDTDADASLRYNIRGIGRNGGSVSFQVSTDRDTLTVRAGSKLGNKAMSTFFSKSGTIEDVNVKTVVTYDEESITIEGMLKTKDNIEGSIQIKTPVTDFRNVGMKLTHTGDLTDFVDTISIDYMDNKNINGKLELSVDGIRRLRFSSELSTPFENMKSSSLKINNDFDSYNMGLSGNAHFNTDMGSGSIQYSKSGKWNNLVTDIKTVLNGQQLTSLKITNTFQDGELNTALNVESIWSPKLSLTLYHSGDLNNFNSNARGSYGRNNIVSTEITFKKIGNTIDGFGKMMYSLRNVGSNQASMKLEKGGEMNDITVKLTTKYGNEEVVISGALNTKDKISGSLNVNTGVNGYRNVGLSFSHSGNMDRFVTEANMNLMDGENYSTKVDFYRYYLRRIETTVELKTPISGYEYTKFEYRHEGQQDSFTCYATLECTGSEKITYDLTVTTNPKPDFSLKIKTPFSGYENLLISASFENSWPKMTAEGKLKAGNGNTFTVNSEFNAADDITGSFALSTPYKGFKDIGLSFQHSGSSTKFDTNGKLTYMDGEEISGKVKFQLPLKRMIVTAELRTPFEGLELTKYEHKINSNRRNFVVSSSFIYGTGKVISEDVTITYSPNPSYAVTITTPVPSLEELKASSSIDVSGSKYELRNMLSAGPGRVITLNGDFDADDVSGQMILETPFDGFTKVGANFMHKGSDQKFSSEGKITYMDNTPISGKVNFFKYGWRKIVASAELSTPFSGMETTKADVTYEDFTNRFSATAGVEFSNGQKVNGNLKFTSSPNYDVLITLNTPYYNYRTVRVEGSLGVTSPSYSISSSLNFGNNNAYSANGKLNLYSANNADGSLELTSPYERMKYTKVDYRYRVAYPRADGMISLNYDNGKVISGELKSTVSPSFDSSVTIKTPFYGYETLKGSATFDSSYNKYDTSSTLNLGNGQSFTMTSGIDYSIEPFKVFSKISTPYRDFQNVEVMATHEGTMTDFKCTGFFSSPLTKNVNAKASLNYDSMDHMRLSGSLKSAMTSMDDLLVELTRTDMAGEKKTHVVLGWTDGQEIVADSLYRRTEGWYQNKIHTDISLTTPFVAVRNMNLQVDHSDLQSSGEDKVHFDLNGTPLLNVNAEYSTKDKIEGSLTFTDPWPMMYTASASNDGGVSVANIYINWDRDDYNSNLRMDGTYSDKSSDRNVDNEFDLSVESPSRKVGVSHKISGARQAITSNGKVYWDSDDSSKVSYEFSMNDNSRRGTDVFDGSIKFGLPTRSLGLTGTYSDNKVTTSADTTFSWDADRDDSKQVGVKTSVTRGDPIKGEISLIMPTIQKEISFSGEVMVNSGRVIFDTKTDISYSEDSRKTLTLTSRLEDISRYSRNSNYSLALGVKHPYTNVDISMNSHLGRNKEMMTVGVLANYLSAQRQYKNMALLAEIDSLKRQMSVQMINPMHHVEIIGDIVSDSPYKVRMINRLDGEEAFRSDLTVDSNKKTLVAKAVMGGDAIAFGAKYPNSTSFRADLSHYHNGESHQEALLALRLNTSRLLHTRLTWNSDMLDELRAFVLERVALGGRRIKNDIAVINEAVAQELSAKYRDIAESGLKELKPILNILQKEMNELAIKLHGLSGSLREMYERNDFYIQDMGDDVNKAYMALQEKLVTLNHEYVRVYSNAIREMTKSMREFAAYPLGQHYNDMAKEASLWIDQQLEQSLQCISGSLNNLDQALKEYSKSLGDMRTATMNTIYNTSYYNAISNKVNTITPYIKSFKMPQEYSEAIYSVHSAINKKVNNMIAGIPEIAYVKGGVNEVYQQGLWAYNYWQLEENIHRHIQFILHTIKEIIHDELQRNIQMNPITVWLPEEIQMELPLPVDVRRLDSLEDLKPLMESAENWLEKRMPDKDTLDNLLQSAFQLWEDADEPSLSDDLENFKPSRKLRKLRKARRYRKKAYRQ